VSGLSQQIDSQRLEEIFAKYGKVAKAAIMYEPGSRHSRGFGFVTMDTAEEAEAAITALNGTELANKTLVIEKAKRGRARTPTPGQYFGPPKRRSGRYEPRPYDSRYADRDRRDHRGRYDDRDRDRERYDDRKHDDRDRDYRRDDRDRDRYRDDRYSREERRY